MIARAVVGEQPRSVNDLGGVDPRGLQCQLQRIGDILGLHRRAQLPGDDVAREVVEHGRQIEPAPADHLEIGEVGLPQLIGRRRLVLELIGRLHDDEGRAGDQVVGLQQSIDRCLRHKVLLRSVKRTASSRGDSSGSSRASSTTCSRTSSGMRFHTRSGPGRSVFQGFRPTALHSGRTTGKTSPGRIPSVASVRRTGRRDCSTRRMISSFSEAGYLIARLPHPRSCFF